MCGEEEVYQAMSAEEMSEYNRRLAVQVTQKVTIGVVTATVAGLTYDQFKKRQRLLNIHSNH